MGNCCQRENPQLKEEAKRELLAKDHAESLQQEDTAVMLKHRERVLIRVNPPHLKPMTEDELRTLLTSIFNQYDKNGNGSLSMGEFRKLINDLVEKKTGEGRRFKDDDVRDFMARIGGEDELISKE